MDTPTAYGSYQARDQSQDAAVTYTTAAAIPDPYPLCHSGNSLSSLNLYLLLFNSVIWMFNPLIAIIGMCMYIYIYIYKILLQRSVNQS